MNKELFRKIERLKEIAEDFKRTENDIKDIKKSIWQERVGYFIRGYSGIDYDTSRLCIPIATKEDYQKIMEVVLTSREERLKNLTKEALDILNGKEE